ncbi:MAG: hypothetical protein CMG57_04055 [Candidatus Marinimicrobia bacterium]|nr:hypothetical protein [Candidatus Neomarinimicrobiota bacterium]|tara:strand:- start:985 stop:1407 length:423 start_codon:yes stop_codon:yes gene_type:complete
MKKVISLFFSSILLVLVSCEEKNNDEEILPEYGSISGNVNFTGTWPDTGEVLITLDTVYPPQGPPAKFSYITSDNVQSGNYSFSFDSLSFRTYDAVTITYWSLGYATAGTNYILIGSYINSIDLTQDNPDFTIDIDANFN